MKIEPSRPVVRILRSIRSRDDVIGSAEPVASVESEERRLRASPPRSARPQPAVDDLHTRIVVPRQGRVTEDGGTLPEIALREVRHGAASRGPYLRVLRHQPFNRQGGHLQATMEASRPRGRLGNAVATTKRAALGTPFATSRLLHERLTKVRALGVFSSDPLSSAAYSAEEIMLVLVLAGTGALYLTLPITAALLALLWTVRLSYIQTIKAYPKRRRSLHRCA
jgi:hypothetical protein